MYNPWQAAVNFCGIITEKEGMSISDALFHII